jgi:PDZ domain-containing secreted protein
MNIYKAYHHASCPNGSLRDTYAITIRSEATIMVEDIIKTLADAPATIYQEDLATLLRAKLGAEVTVEGWHHGIKITSLRK